MRRNAFWGILLIVVGILFLANSLGFINVDVWGALWALVILGAGLWLLLRFTLTREFKDTGSINIPLDGASKAKVDLRHGAGRLSVTGGADPGDVLSGTYNSRLTHKAERVGETIEVKVREETWMLPFAEPRHWTFRCSDQVPLSLNVNSGAGETRLDLTELRVSDLRLSAGASDTQVTLPARAGFTKAKIDSGVASIRIRIPDGVAASISAGGGLTNISVDRNRFPRMAGRNQSPDYEEAENRVELNVSTGVGAIDIR